MLAGLLLVLLGLILFRPIRLSPDWSIDVKDWLHWAGVTAATILLATSLLALRQFRHNLTPTWLNIHCARALVEPTDAAVDIKFGDETQYSSSIPISEVARDDMILVIYADGELLNREQGAPFRVVLPCYWGYKWVKYVSSIEISTLTILGTGRAMDTPVMAGYLIVALLLRTQRFSQTRAW